MASCTVLTTDNPDSSTVMPAATTSDGRAPSGNTPAASRPTVDNVANRPPTTCRKNVGNPKRDNSRPVRSINAVTTNASPAVTGAPPSRIAIVPARSAQPAVATQRG